MCTASIKFVRVYTSYGEEVVDVIYKSGRCVTHYGSKNVPKTVRRFIWGKPAKVQMDKLHGEEYIYEKEV